MSKKWTWDEDRFLASYFDAVGDMIGPRDLSRPKGAATKRVEKLKECGAWDALKAHMASDFTHKRAYYAALGNSVAVNDLDEFHVGSPEWDDVLSSLVRANGERRVS